MRVWLFVFLVLSASASVTAENPWHWVKASNNTKGWTVSEGNAEVTIQGEKFSAKLFWNDSDTKVQIALNGTLKNGRITVKEAIQNSDYTGSTYHGTLEKKKWEEFSGTIGAESITLSDGWGMIGITRNITGSR